jgi:hypothetical protein
MKPAFLFFTIMLLPSIAIADGFDILGNHRELNGFTIIDTGNVGKVKVPNPISVRDKQSLYTEEKEFFKLNLRCFN